MKIYGFCLETGTYTAVCIETKRGGQCVHTLTQSFSLSHITTNLWPQKSSKKYKIALVLSQIVKLKLELPPGLPPHEVSPTVSWLLEQQGYTPLSRWLWDYQPVNHSEVDVLLCDSERYHQVLASLHPNPEQLQVVLVCDAESLHRYNPAAENLLKNQTGERPDNADNATAALAAALACRSWRYV